MSMSYRRLDASHDFVFGQGRGDYLNGVDAVAQAIETGLLLFLGEWWEDINDGLPLWQTILGGRGSNKQLDDRIIQDRILTRPNVTGISNLVSTFNPSTRAYNFTARVDTVFGQVTISTGGA